MALELLKMNGQLWHLGSQLKSWLDRDEGAAQIDVNQVLKKIEITMDEIRRKAASV